jgi:hypothetical protein
MPQISSLLAVMISLNAGLAVAQRAEREQARFGLEEPVVHPVPVPGSVLQILRTDPAVLQSGCFEKEKPSDPVLASWFEPSEVQLHRERQRDLLVKAKNGCLLGANIGPFWIFGSTREGYEVLLSTSALSPQGSPDSV